MRFACILVGSGSFHVCGLLGFFFPRGLKEELFAWAISPLAFLSLCRAGFATWLSLQWLDGELKQRKGLGDAKEERHQHRGSQEPAARHPLALKALSLL